MASDAPIGFVRRLEGKDDMTMTPLGFRVLVQPDEAPTEHAGLILPEDRDHVEVSGAVVAVGKGSAWAHRIRQRAILDCIEAVERGGNFYGTTPVGQLVRADLEQLIGTAAESELRVGDRVVFAAESGMNISQDGQAYILLNEDDCVLLVNEEAAA